MLRQLLDGLRDGETFSLRSYATSIWFWEVMVASS